MAQGITGVQHEGEDCTIRLVEEFRASDKSGDWCQIPQRRRGTSVIDAKTMLADFISILLCDDVAHKVVQGRIGDFDLDELSCCG